MFTEQQLDRAEDEVFPCHAIERNSDALRTIYYLAHKNTWNQGDKAYLSQFITRNPKSNYGPYLDILLKDTPSWHAYREWRLDRFHKSEVDDAMEEYARAENLVYTVIIFGTMVIVAGLGVLIGYAFSR